MAGIAHDVRPVGGNVHPIIPNHHFHTDTGGEGGLWAEVRAEQARAPTVPAVYLVLNTTERGHISGSYGGLAVQAGQTL